MTLRLLHGLAGLDTPALLVDVARLDENLRRVSEDLAGAGVGLRPHWKTSKSLEVARRQRALGAIGFTCSTPAEVRALGEAGHRGLLWAHLPVGPSKVVFAVEAVRQYGTTLMVDSVEVAAPLEAALRDADVVADVLLEVDTGLGRTGVDPERAVSVADGLRGMRSLRLAGVMTHEGHLYGFGSDRGGLDSAAVASARALVGVADALRADGHEIDVVSVGSTPGLAAGPYVAGVTEARPGTYVFEDGNQVRLGSCGLDACALTVLARVVSTQRAGTVIIDAGS
ncbi:MAG TPA: alanine racemase, partial [Propionibacteriaceae bacterium]|nr:alanine racemase [Propionibacteriaceae bacterium]